MTLRRPAAHLRRPPNWRRSGDETYWESLRAESENSPRVLHPQRASRPQSAIEGGQLDGWLKHLQRIERDLVKTPGRDQVPAFADQVTSRPGFDREPGGHGWRRQGTFSFSKGSSSCGSPSQCESSLGSQESLQTGLFSPPERRGSWERAHIMQAPRKEQAQLSNLAPVKTGWLPIQRRVMMVDRGCDQNPRFQDHSSNQMRLKQPITPIFPKTPATTNRHKDGEGEKCHTSPRALDVRTWQPPDQGSPFIKQVPEKQSAAVYEGDKPVCWSALRRGWNTNRLSGRPAGSDVPIGISCDPHLKSPLLKATTTEAHEHSPVHQTSSFEPYQSHTVLHGTNTTQSFTSHTPLRRTGSVQPVTPTVSLRQTSSHLQPSHIQTSSAVTTLVPQNKIGFSSITISSKKVSRSSSLPGSSHRSTNPSLPHDSMDPNSRVTVQRKATIVKVTEQRVVPGAVQSTGTPPANHGLDAVVHRRKATIIKVTEHRESYSPGNVKPGKRPTEYRHSYTDGAYKENSLWAQQNHLEHNTVPVCHHLNSAERTNAMTDLIPNTSRFETLKNDGTHTSTLRLFVSSPPAIAAATPSEPSPRAVGQRSHRPLRPQSCYGNVFGHTEPSKENVIPPTVRKWSFELPQETTINTVNSCSRFIRPGATVEKGGQQVADTLKPEGDEKGILPLPEDAARRSSPFLTLIKTPDPQSHQSPEQVIALNAAAIIANIKLQRQLSKKKRPDDNCEESAPHGNIVTDGEKCMKQPPDQSGVQWREQARDRPRDRPHTAYAPHGLEPKFSGETMTLQEALQRSKPHFIARSQDRVQKVEQRAKERREGAGSANLDAARRQRRARSVRFTSFKDNLFKPSNAAITGKETQPRSKCTPADLKRKKEEEKKREVCLNNRQRVELFKKRLLDQILQRSNN